MNTYVCQHAVAHQMVRLRTMPSANKKPIPRTMPYPQAWPRGEAEGPVGAGPPAILLAAEVSRVKPLDSIPFQIDGSRGIYRCDDPRHVQHMSPRLRKFRPAIAAPFVCDVQHDSQRSDWPQIVKR